MKPQDVVPGASEKEVLLAKAATRRSPPTPNSKIAEKIGEHKLGEAKHSATTPAKR